VGREGNHVVERSHFHRSQLSWNGLSPLCLHDNTGLPKAASILGTGDRMTMLDRIYI